jgi:hypothetical protein
MRKLSLVLATATIVVAGAFAWNVQAADQGGATTPTPDCGKAYKNSTECSADKACVWNPQKNACKDAKKKSG